MSVLPFSAGQKTICAFSLSSCIVSFLVPKKNVFEYDSKNILKKYLTFSINLIDEFLNKIFLGRVLDDPRQVKSSLCTAGGEVFRDPSAVLMPSFCTQTYEKDPSRVMKEVDLCSTSISDAKREIQPTRSIGSTSADNFEGFPKMNIMTEKRVNVGMGATPKITLSEGGNCSVGRSSMPKRNSITGSSFVGGCTEFPKESVVTEDGYVTEKNAVVQREPDKTPSLKCIIPNKSFAEIEDNIDNEKGTSAKDLERSPKPSVIEETITPIKSVASKSVASTCGDSLRKEESGSSTMHDTMNSSIFSSKNFAENKLNSGSLLEVGEVYNGFITLVDSFEQFVGVIVVDGTEWIFTETHEILSTSPFGLNFKPEVGSLVAAFSPTEEIWYRARVLEVNGSKCRVCYIDYGNKEVVKQVKPLPEGPFSELPEFAILARLNSKVNGLIHEKLKNIVQVDNPIKFKVIAKKELLVKVALCEPEGEDDTVVAEYVFRPLLMPSSRSLPASTSPKTESSPLGASKENSTTDNNVSAVTSLQKASVSEEKETDLHVHVGKDSLKGKGIISPDHGKSRRQSLHLSFIVLNMSLPMLT